MTRRFKGTYEDWCCSSTVLDGVIFDNLELPFLQELDDGSYEVIKDTPSITAMDGEVELLFKEDLREFDYGISCTITTSNGKQITIHSSNETTIRCDNTRLRITALGYVDLEIGDKILPGTSIQIPPQYFGFDSEGHFNIIV